MLLVATEGRKAVFMPVFAPVQEPVTPQERAAQLTWWLADSDGLMIEDVLRITRMRICYARPLLTLIAEALPLKHDRADCWFFEGPAPRGWRPKFILRRTQQRAAAVVYLLHSGQKLKTSQIAAMCGMTPNAAWHMMASIARVVPVYKDLKSLRWMVCAREEE